MEDATISFVIPCFNEEERLEPKLSESMNFLITSVKESMEFIFVNDGSTDDTEKVLNNLKEKFGNIPIKVMSYKKNQGKGYAVKVGVLESTGKKILVMDADFSIDLSEVSKFMDFLDQYDVVIGTKKHFLTQTVTSQKAPRRFLGKGFTLLANFLMGINFTDITCGFKGFKSHAAEQIFQKQKVNRWSYDAETLFLASKLKFNTKEVPVRWYHIEGSKVSPVIDTFRSLKDLMLIIFNYYSGKYN